MIVNNEAEMTLYLNSVFYGAINYTIDRMVELIRQEITRQGIGDESKNTIYDPTNEFYNAWRKESVSKVGGYILGKMGYDSSFLSLDKDSYTHGSNYQGGSDVRDALADIIFNGKSGMLFGDGFWRDNRDAWTPFMNQVQAEISSWFVIGCAKSGLQIDIESGFKNIEV